MAIKELEHLLKDGAKSLGSIKSSEDLISAVSSTLKAEGKSEAQYDMQKAIEAKMAAGMLETKANEVMHTGNSGYGAELVPGAIQTTDFLDLAPKLNPLLGAFPGFHGRNLPKIAEVPVIGELPLHNLAGEWTTGAPGTKITQGAGKLPTAKVTLTQKKYLFSVDISDEETRFVTVIDLISKIQMKLAESSARTMISAIINGDTDANINTNINLIDGTPGGTEHYLGGDGLRKKALASATTSFDAGTFGFADFLTLIQALGENAADPEQLLWIFGRYSHSAALGLDEFKNAYINGVASTALSGRVPPFLGSDVAINRYLGKANASGKVSATPANNSKGQIMLVHKSAVQYGYNGDYSIELYRVPGFGWQVLGYYYMGFAISSGDAGTDPTVAELYNVT